MEGKQGRRSNKKTTVNLKKRRKRFISDVHEHEDSTVMKKKRKTTEGKKSKKAKLKKKSKAEKNRPLELPSNKPVKRYENILALSRKHKRSDPRFDPMCGDFSEQGFRDSYSFLDDYKEEEQKDLKRLRKKLRNKTKKLEVNTVLKQYDVEQKSEEKKDRQRHLAADWKKTEFAARAAGKKPFYLKKNEQKKLMLADQYLHLKKTGGLKKTIDKRRKKQAAKDRRWLTDRQRGGED